MNHDLTVPEPHREPLVPAEPGQLPAGGDRSYGAPPAEEQGVQWGRYLDSIRRHKWLVLLVTIAGTALGFFVTQFLTPKYTAQATIWIAEGGRNAGATGPIRAPQLLQEYAWVELVNSYAVLDPVVQKMALNVVPADEDDAAALEGIALNDKYRLGSYQLLSTDGGQGYVIQTAGGAVVDKGRVGGPVGTALGVEWTPSAAALAAASPVGFSITSVRDAANGLKGRLTPKMATDGTFLQLTLRGDEPQRLTETLNTLTTEFVSVAADLKQRKLTEYADILDGQLKTSERKLKGNEIALENFRVKTITEPTEGGTIAAGLEVTQAPVMSSFFLQKAEMDRVQADRAALQRVLAGIRNGSASVDAFYGIPSVQTAPELQAALSEMVNKQAELRALETRYTGEYPLVQNLRRSIQELRTQTIPQLATGLINRLGAQGGTLAGQIQGAERELQQIPARTIEEARLRREVEISDNLYKTLQARYEEARLAEASASPDVRILDAAVAPQTPSEDNAPRILLMAFLASFGTALGGAVLLGHADKRFRYPDQVTHDLGLSILGAVPGMRPDAEENAEQTAQMVESFRTIRLNLAHAYGAAGPIVLAVSSPNTGDGKSFVSSNLALSYADAGCRTLLIDGDIRQGDIHRMFQLERRPGLMDLLGRSADEREVLKPTRHENLTLITSGTRTRRGPELLGSNALASLLAAAKSRFDVIIIDTPPLSAGIDPFVLGTATGNMLLVLRSGETDRKLAEAKLEMLDRLPIRLLGAVLNDVSAQGAYRYYAYDYAFSGEELEGYEDGPHPQLARSS